MTPNNDTNPGLNQELLDALLRRVLSSQASGPSPTESPPAMGGGQPSVGYQQALIWAALGAAAAWVLSDAEIRNKLIKQVMRLYAETVVGFEEMKEKVADMKAEVDAGLTSPPSQG